VWCSSLLAVSPRALILVERESQAPILLGAGGRAINKLGRAARQQIEEFLGRPVYLELSVQVGDV
jgi:GTP-binding protein Era